MNILITSAGRRSYLIEYFKQAFHPKGNVFASNSEYTIALQKADGFFISPKIYDEEYVESIISFCKEKNISAIISVFDIDLLVLSKNKKRFLENGIYLILSDYDSVFICNDKWETYKFFINNGFGSPKSYLKLEDVKKDLSNNSLNFPLIIKPRWGMASMSIYKANTIEELDFFYNYAKSEVFKSHLKYESSLTPEEPIIVQEMINGQEYGIDVIADFSSNYIGVFPKSKLIMRAGETDLGQTVQQSLFDAYGRKLNDLLGVVGILSVDCFISGDKYYFIEMNCRISGHYPLSHLAGVNFPKQIFEWLNSKTTNPDYFNFRENIYVTKDLTPVILHK